MQKLYMLAVLLPDSLEELILQFKEEIAHRYRSVAALRPMGHIVLQNTFIYDDAELPRLEIRLDEAFSCATPFRAELENFGAFPPHTIFAAVKDFFPFQQLRDSVYAQLRNEILAPEGALGQRSITPHITIAHRDLSPEAFELAWNDFCARELSESFTVSSAHLLEQRGKWRSVREFPFRSEQSRLMNSLQLDLFCA